MRDIPKALIVAAVLGVIAAGMWRCANANDWQPPELTLDALRTDAPAPECHRSGWIGRVDLFAPYRLSPHVVMGLTYTHNSCLDEENDRADSDAAGIRFRIILGD